MKLQFWTILDKQLFYDLVRPLLLVSRTTSQTVVSCLEETSLVGKWNYLTNSCFISCLEDTSVVGLWYSLTPSCFMSCRDLCS